MSDSERQAIDEIAATLGVEAHPAQWSRWRSVEQVVEHAAHHRIELGPARDSLEPEAHQQ